MTTLPRTSKIVHYAAFGDLYGTAERTNGGYIFRPDDTSHKAILVDYRNVDLYLFGVKPLADAQWAADQAQGGLVTRTSRTRAA
jgi:hypothetical protein